MILVIEAADRQAKHKRLLQALFRQRFEHFVLRRNWSIPSRDGLDVDQYDAADAVYFACLEADGHLAGSVRLNRSLPSSLLGDLFPYLIETGEEPRGATIFEGSRFIVSPSARGAGASGRVKAELLTAIVEYCLEHGGTEFQAVIEDKMLATFVAMSLRTRVLGLAHEYGGGVRAFGGGRCIAFRWQLCPELLADLRHYGGQFAPPAAIEQIAAASH